MDFKQYLGNDGCWYQLRKTLDGNMNRPVLFLDRDGVIVEEAHYLHQVEQVKFIDGVIETILLAREAGWAVVMVTNQAGIGRGYYGWKEFSKVNEFILCELDSHCAYIDAVLAVPHHEQADGEYYSANHPMRKPNPGMLIAGARMTKGNLENSILVGDNITDVKAAHRANIKAAYLVRTGHGKNFQNEIHQLQSNEFQVQVVNSIAAQEIKKEFQI